MAVLAVVVGGTLLGSLVTASADIPPNWVDFQKLNTDVPVAGHWFEGLAIINRSGLSGPPKRFTAVHCDAAVGSKRLRAKHLVYGIPRRGFTQVVVCGWHIPADAAGKTVRLWNNRDPNCICGDVAIVKFNNDTYGSAEFAWRVTNP